MPASSGKLGGKPVDKVQKRPSVTGNVDKLSTFNGPVVEKVPVYPFLGTKTWITAGSNLSVAKNGRQMRGCTVDK
jgi:hypothetical protein